MIDIVTFAEQHADGVSELCRGLNWTTYSDADTARRGCAAPGVSTIIALDSDQVVGFAQAVGDVEAGAYLSQVAVSPAHRRQGVGRRLVERLFLMTGALRLDAITDEAAAFCRSFPHKQWLGFRIYDPRIDLKDEPPAAATPKPRRDDELSIKRINPPALHRPPGYHHVTVVESPKMAMLAGQCPLDQEGDVIGLGDLARQVDQIVTNATVALDAVGASPDQVVRSIIYVVTANDEELGAVWTRFLDSTLAPAFSTASTLLGVAALGYPGQRVELDLTAALPA